MRKYGVVIVYHLTEEGYILSPSATALFKVIPGETDEIIRAGVNVAIKEWVLSVKPGIADSELWRILFDHSANAVLWDAFRMHVEYVTNSDEEEYMGGYTKVPTWLPLFPGFYETGWEIDWDRQREEIQECLSYVGEKHRGVICDFAEKELERIMSSKEVVERDSKVVQYAGEWIAGQLNNSGIEIPKFEVEGIVSPRFYNYVNDSVNCTFWVAKRAIAHYLGRNSENFEIYLKNRYTSRDGFCSSYSTDPDEWISLFMEDDTDLTHELGAVLEFILLNNWIFPSDDYAESEHGALWNMRDEMHVSVIGNNNLATIEVLGLQNRFEGWMEGILSGRNIVGDDAFISGIRACHYSVKGKRDVR